MIREVSGDILLADTEAIVNPVNTVGVMGAGLALQFKCKYPEMYREYHSACRAGWVTVGKMHLYPVAGPTPLLIVNFPTKKHWSDPSELKWIDQGLDDLQKVIQGWHLRSIAIPPLGCGLGGLNWADVRKLIEEQLGDLDVDVVLYVPKPPGGAP